MSGEAGIGMVGELAMGRFRVLERVGSGGMGTVYRAFDERLQRQVALKEIVGDDAPRVLREAHAAARLNHPSIVTLYELGSDAHRTVLISELVEGATLADLSRCGDLTDREVGEFGVDVCAALDHAHERGVIHRDVKPENVIVQVDAGVGRRAKLTDFGVASLAGTPTLSSTGEVVGTLAYMAPEQAEGEPAGEPADVYSLALTLFECWAGANPVARETPVRTAREIGAPLPSLAEYRPDLSEPISACIDACLRPEPDLRPTLADLRSRLERSLGTLDDDRSVGLEWSAEPRSEPVLALRAAQLLALCSWSVAVAAIAAVGGRPGLALVLGALSAPAIVVASRLPWAGVPLLAPLLAPLSAASVYPAIAGSRGSRVERAVLGALGWAWLMVGAAVVHAGPRLGLVDTPPAGWSRSTAAASSALLAPLLDPQALLGAAIFAVAAVLLGEILRTGHVALALLGVLLWSAGLEGALRVVVDGRLAGSPALIAAAGLVAVMVEFRRRGPRATAQRAPIPGVRPALRATRPAPMP